MAAPLAQSHSPLDEITIGESPRPISVRSDLVNRPLPYIAALVSWLSLSPLSQAADRHALELKDGDRIVLLGDDLIERNQKHGYLETLLTLSNPKKTLTFRNLGWSGDTVFGDARAGFGTRPDGFKHLKEHVLALQPTVILVGYGMSESFDGEAGLPSFVKGLNELLDVLAVTKASIVLLSPISHEDLGRPLPDPAAHNQSLQLYREAIARTAGTRGLPYIDLASVNAESARPPSSLGEAARPLTDDGIHLTENGYWLADSKVASEFGEGLGKGWSVHVRPDGTAEATHAIVSNVLSSSQRARFEVLDASLPLPARPASSVKPRWLNDEALILEFERLDPGRYTHNIDVKSIATASADQWQRMELKQGPEFDQVERLRSVINEKNLLYFHRWRPQNETYLFGFRKHEQGNNAREIPLFDPLVEAKEKEIAALRTPVSHVYELVLESEVGR
jgi:hypothetical protein